jgi:hypothetical protein
MPSQLHEALLLLFRNRPLLVLAAELLEAGHDVDGVADDRVVVPLGGASAGRAARAA